MPIGWVAAAGAVAGIAGSVLQSNAATSAAQTQAGAAENAQQISQNEFNTITAQNQPFLQSGYGALSALDYGLGISPQTATGGAPAATQPTGNSLWGVGATAFDSTPTGSLTSAFSPASGAATNYQNLVNPRFSASQGMPSGQMAPATSLTPTGTGGQGTGLGYGSLTAPFTTANWQQLSPNYNFQLRQGQQGVLNSDAAGQGSLSGAALKDLTNYNQSEANTSFNNAFNQYQTQQGNIFSRLSGIASLGQTSASNTGTAGTNLAGQAGQAAVAAGSYLGAGQIGSASAISGGLSSAIPWLYGGGGGAGGSGAPDYGTGTLPAGNGYTYNTGYP